MQSSTEQAKKIKLQMGKQNEGLMSVTAQAGCEQIFMVIKG